MPNTKIYVEEKLWGEQSESIQKALYPLRELLCEGLNVTEAVCQIAIVPFCGMDGQAEVSLEMQLLPKPDRTQETVISVCKQTQAFLTEVTGKKVAVRATALDPVTYVIVR